MDVDKDKPVYVISVVSEMLCIPPQTLRIYEKARLVIPRRTARNTRLYSQRDVEKLQRIVRLHQDLGINLAGIEVIIHMRQKMEKLQGDFRKFAELISKRFGDSFSPDTDEESTDLVPLSDTGAYIMRLIDMQLEELEREARSSSTRGDSPATGDGGDAIDLLPEEDG